MKIRHARRNLLSSKTSFFHEYGRFSNTRAQSEYSSTYPSHTYHTSRNLRCTNGIQLLARMRIKNTDNYKFVDYIRNMWEHWHWRALKLCALVTSISDDKTVLRNTQWIILRWDATSQGKGAARIEKVQTGGFNTYSVLFCSALHVLKWVQTQRIKQKENGEC